MYFSKDFLVNLQISLPRDSTEAWRFEGLKQKVWILFCQIKIGSCNKCTLPKELREDNISSSLKV